MAFSPPRNSPHGDTPADPGHSDRHQKSVYAARDNVQEPTRTENSLHAGVVLSKNKTASSRLRQDFKSPRAVRTLCFSAVLASSTKAYQNLSSAH